MISISQTLFDTENSKYKKSFFINTKISHFNFISHERSKKKLFLFCLIEMMKIETILFRNQTPAVLFDVVDTNSSSGVSIAEGGVVNGTAAKFYECLTN